MGSRFCRSIAILCPHFLLTRCQLTHQIQTSCYFTMLAALKPKCEFTEEVRNSEGGSLTHLIGAKMGTWTSTSLKQIAGIGQKSSDYDLLSNRKLGQNAS